MSKPPELYEGASSHPGSSENPVQRGDGAVVREIFYSAAQGCFYFTTGPGALQHALTGYDVERDHNALCVHALAQAAEIERLTAVLEAEQSLGKELSALAQEHASKRYDAEARNADLLKALERYGQHELGCRGVCGPAFSAIPYPCSCGLAAAKGETVSDRSMLEVPPYKGAGR